jgi:peptidoglycan/xylan/chitin deacetylase (PgdA/CDA1 family)
MTTAIAALAIGAALEAFAASAMMPPPPGPVGPPPPGTPSPVAAPTPWPEAPPAARAPRTPAEAGGRPLRRVETREPAVAITFDACATRTQGYSFDRAVFETLERERVPATIFVSGRWVESHPDVMTMLARDPLIEFGDHSYDHPHMARLQEARAGEEIDRTEAALARYGKRAVAFRPPFGEWNQRLIGVARERSLPVVTWDVVSGDPSARTTAAGMIRTVVSRARPGSIVVFHINGRGWKTGEALPEIVRGLRARGFRFVQLSELLGALPAPQVAAGPAGP